VFSGFEWPLPNGGPGEWVDAKVEPCRSGIHACRLSDLPLWVGRELYEVELDGEIAEQPMKVVASRGRLLRRIEAWDDDARDAYTRMCADRAVHDVVAGPRAGDAREAEPHVERVARLHDRPLLDPEAAAPDPVVAVRALGLAPGIPAVL
jgi:hypothetical protein